MDQHTQYLMMMRSKDLMIMNSYNHSTSWEEKAFAEDGRGPLGGFIWPPRSYSCSFCNREFRSAQALGGHMNVHRRERARLKQSDDNPPPDSPPQSATLSKSLESSLSNPSFVLASSSLSPPSRVSSPVLGHGIISLLDWHDHNDRNDVETNFILGDLSLDLSRSYVNRVDQGMEEIDLELRLGVSPKMN